MAGERWEHDGMQGTCEYVCNVYISNKNRMNASQEFSLVICLLMFGGRTNRHGLCMSVNLFVIRCCVWVARLLAGKFFVLQRL